MRVIVVGGFLGAGKTTLLAQAAKRLAGQGLRVGIITNDQAADLVDTHFLAGSGVAVAEVAGGCFCCRFEDLERAAGELLEKERPDVLLTEPVGSCTDISATVLQPMKLRWGQWARLSPFSVLADPRRLEQVLGAGEAAFPDSVRYIIRKQLEEADMVVVNKIDLVSPEALEALEQRIASTWPGVRTLRMSALQNRGVAEWLDTVSDLAASGRKILDVDYDTYARGEAELGWLNASLVLESGMETDWDAFAREVIGRIHADLAARRAEIGHLKLMLSRGKGELFASVTGIGQPPVVRGGAGAGAGSVSMLLNARACLDPGVLESVVKSAVAAASGKDVEASEFRVRSFRPAYPRPTHRFPRVLE